MTRAEIEREMRKLGGSSAVTFDAAVSVTERLLREQEERINRAVAQLHQELDGPIFSIGGVRLALAILEGTDERRQD